MDRIVVIPEDTPRALGAALALWTLTAALAASAGAFERFAPGEFTALAAFASAFALATARLDRGVRAALSALAAGRLAAGLAAADALLVIAAAFAWARPGDPLATLAAFPFALAPLVVLPVAVALHGAALGRLLAARRPVSSAEPKGPAPNPVAT